MSDIQRAKPAQSTIPKELLVEALNTVKRLYLEKFKNYALEGG